MVLLVVRASWTSGASSTRPTPSWSTLLGSQHTDILSFFIHPYVSLTPVLTFSGSALFFPPLPFFFTCPFAEQAGPGLFSRSCLSGRFVAQMCLLNGVCVVPAPLFTVEAVCFSYNLSVSPICFQQGFARARSIPIASIPLL